MGNQQMIVGHIEKKEEPDDTVQEQGQVEQMEGVQVKKTTEQEDTTTEEEGLATGPRKQKTQSITAMKKVAIQAKIKEQKRR